jgi:hypothetical protein
MQVEAFVIWYPDRAPFDMPAYIPDAAQNALDSIEAEEHGRAKPQ